MEHAFRAGQLVVRIDNRPNQPARSGTKCADTPRVQKSQHELAKAGACNAKVG